MRMAGRRSLSSHRKHLVVPRVIRFYHRLPTAGGAAPFDMAGRPARSPARSACILGDALDDGPVLALGAAEVVGHDDGEDVAFGAYVGAGIEVVGPLDREHFACRREACRDHVRFGGHEAAPDAVLASCWASQRSTSDVRQARRLPILNERGPYPVESQ